MDITASRVVGRCTGAPVYHEVQLSDDRTALKSSKKGKKATTQKGVLRFLKSRT